MIAQVCEYTKNHWIVYFKWVNCMLCELQFNEAVTKQNKQNHTLIDCFKVISTEISHTQGEFSG